MEDRKRNLKSLIDCIAVLRNLDPVDLCSFIVGYSKVISHTKFEHFGVICFCFMLRTLVWKMHLLTL